METYDVIIIGGGPAGLTAGMYSSRARMKTLLLEKSAPGGQLSLTDKIENYPGFPGGISGMELVENMKKQAVGFGLEIASGDVREVRESETEKGKDCWEVITTGSQYTALTLIAASGGSARKLDVPGEKELTGRGVSYCATCDGAFFKGKDIVVVGGGDAAVEEALFLTKFGRQVTLVHRRDRLRASKILQERAEANEKLRFTWDSVVTAISGDKKVQSVKLKNLKTHKETDLSCDGVFIFIGFVPVTHYLKELVNLDDKGYIKTDNNMSASRKGVFACGDCRSKLLQQVVNACGEGALASYSAGQYVDELKGVAYK